MRISDWSSDVCSSDLPAERFAEDLAHRVAAVRPGFSAGAQPVAAPVVSDHMTRTREYHPPDAVVAHRLKQVYDRAYVVREHWQIGRASCRERVCQYV